MVQKSLTIFKAVLLVMEKTTCTLGSFTRGFCSGFKNITLMLLGTRLNTSERGPQEPYRNIIFETPSIYFGEWPVESKNS
jgi:hypothetical protein